MTSQPAPEYTSVFRWSGQSGRFTARRVLGELTQKLTETGLQPEQVQTTELVVAEALNNVMEHACEEKDGIAVALDLRRSDASIEVEIRDAGRPMPGLDLSATHHRRMSGPDTDVPFYALPEGGFGWFLIYDLTDSVSYAHQDNCNTLRLRISIAPHA